MTSFSVHVTPEWGGQCHGPFNGSIVLGSDSSRCEIVLRADFPIEPEHVRLSQTKSPWELLLEPVSRGYGVFLWRDNQAWQVTQPCLIQHGEFFSVISPVGPSMQVVVHEQDQGVESRGSSNRPKGDRREKSDWKLALMLILGGATLLGVLVLVLKIGNLSPPPQKEEPENVSYRSSTSSSEDNDNEEERPPGLHWEDLTDANAQFPLGYFRNGGRKPDRFPDRFALISGENNWRSGRISGGEQFRKLKEEKGIQTVINLAYDSVEPQEDRDLNCGGLEKPCEPKWAKKYGLRYITVYLGNKGPSDENWMKILEALGQGNTLIHCTYGVDRTGAVAGRWHRCFDEEQNLTQQEIIDYTYHFGGQWQHKGDPNRYLRDWMLAENPCLGWTP